MNSDDDVRQKTGSTHGMTDRALPSLARWFRRTDVLDVLVVGGVMALVAYTIHAQRLYGSYFGQADKIAHFAAGGAIVGSVLVMFQVKEKALEILWIPPLGAAGVYVWSDTVIALEQTGQADYVLGNALWSFYLVALVVVIVADVRHEHAPLYAVGATFSAGFWWELYEALIWAEHRKPKFLTLQDYLLDTTGDILAVLLGGLVVLRILLWVDLDAALLPDPA